MKYPKKTFFLAIVFTTILACSTKKDTVINRNFHALTTKYNVLFNGEEAFKEGLEAINTTFEDDFWKQIPIEPLEFTKEVIEVPKFDNGGFSGFGDADKNKKKTSASNSPFDRAEEKAVKAIQIHSMNIKDKERNRQIDDAYLLLGKSRYYSQRYIPAVEAFNYVIENYPDASLINETKIWRAKANIRLDNEQFAIESLKYLLVVKDTLEANLSATIKEQGYTALAMAYMASDSLQKAKNSLIKATRTTVNKEQAARNLFVLGQIYASEEKKDSASLVFKKLLNFKKAPYKYKMYANLEIVKNFPKDSSSTKVRQKLKKLLKNRDNRPYLDGLYYHLGVLEENRDSISLAIKNYNKSLRVKSAKPIQKTYTYERLGNLYFKDNKYQLASAYYDSVLKAAKDDKELRIRRVARKFKNLASLIKYEKTVYENDSILRLAAMPVAEQEAYFQIIVDKLKKKDEEEAQKRLNKLAFGGSFGSSLQSTNKGKWYFYNGQSLSFGKTEFQKIWGNRALEDNWRWSSKVIISEQKTDSLQTVAVNNKYDVKTYVSNIPKNKAVLDSLKTDRNQSLFELGLIYKQQFVNLPLSSKKLERLLTLQPQKSKLLPIYYNLYQIYKEAGDLTKSDFYKNKVLSNYPDTSFAQIILFPNKKVKDEKLVNKTEETYKKIYYMYSKQLFREVVLEVEEVLPSVQDTELMPKFELLRALAIGKTRKLEVYKKALDFVAISYNTTEEGKRAKEILQQLNK